LRSRSPPRWWLLAVTTIQQRPGGFANVMREVYILSKNGDELTVCYNRQRFARGFTLANVTPKDIDRAALECFEACLSAPELALSFDLEPGDMLFANNRTMLHRRTAFVDYSDRRRGRLMLRLLLTRHS